MGNPLDIYEFGRQLIETKDLDPVYVLLWNAGLDSARLKRWLLSYWCFYHVGTASWILDQPSYWKAMATAAGSKEYPRCPERRHFRGDNAKKSVEYLQGRGLSELFDSLLQETTAVGIMSLVQGWVGFGPWISFKVADMLERLGLSKLEFGRDEVMYESPLEGAKLLYDVERGGEPPTDVGDWAIDAVLQNLGSLKAPPRYERSINAQEVETILCKWKSHMAGRYHVGEDIESCRKGLTRFDTPTNQRLIESGRKGELWRAV